MFIKTIYHRVRDFFQLARLSLLHRASQLLGEIDLAIINPADTFQGRIMRTSVGFFANTSRLESTLLGGMSFQIVRTASRIGLFDLLYNNTGLKLPEIADRLNLEPYGVEVILLGLTSLHLVNRIGEKYYVEPLLIKPLLTGSQNPFLIELLEYLHHVVLPAMNYLEESTRNHTPAGLKALFGENASNFYSELGRDEERNAYFESFMRLYTCTNRDRVAALSVFGPGKKVLDVGGNTGELSQAIAAHHPRTHVTVLDLPEVVHQTNKRFADNPYRERLHTYAGNIFEAPMPPGFDCIIFAHFIDIFSPEENLSFLQRAFDALNPRGIVCIFTPVVYDDESGPFINGVWSSYFLALANGRGRFYSARTISEWLSQVGFGKIQRIPLPNNEAFLTATRPF